MEHLLTPEEIKQIDIGLTSMQNELDLFEASYSKREMLAFLKEYIPKLQLETAKAQDAKTAKSVEEIIKLSNEKTAEFVSAAKDREFQLEREKWIEKMFDKIESKVSIYNNVYVGSERWQSLKKKMEV